MLRNFHSSHIASFVWNEKLTTRFLCLSTHLSFTRVYLYYFFFSLVSIYIKGWLKVRKISLIIVKRQNDEEKKSKRLQNEKKKREEKEQGKELKFSHREWGVLFSRTIRNTYEKLTNSHFLMFIIGHCWFTHN